jgi:hypothetical protein
MSAEGEPYFLKSDGYTLFKSLRSSLGLKSPRGIVSRTIFARNGSVQETAKSHVPVEASKVFDLIFANWHLVLMGRHRLVISLLGLLLISMILVHLKHLLLLLVLFESQLVHHLVIVERKRGRMDYRLL